MRRQQLSIKVDLSPGTKQQHGKSVCTPSRPPSLRPHCPKGMEPETSGGDDHVAGRSGWQFAACSPWYERAGQLHVHQALRSNTQQVIAYESLVQVAS